MRVTYHHVSNGVRTQDGWDIARFRTLPDGSQELAVHLGGEEFGVVEARALDAQPDPDPTPDPEPDPGEYDVTTTAELLAAIGDATGGETIRLAPGKYGDLDIRNQFSDIVTIAGGTFSSIRVTGARNVVFDDVVTEGTNGDGVFIRSSENVTYQYGAVRGFTQGIRFLECTGMAVLHNDITGISGDGIKVAMVDGLLIEDNDIHDFKVDLSSNKHRDMIQVFTINHDRPSKNITIRGNRLDIGDGDWTQSIWMRNEAVDQGAGNDMFYQNVVIEDNVIRNSQIWGIYVGQADGVRVERNVVEYVPAPTGPDHPAPPNAPTPNISVNEASVNVSLIDNTTPGYHGNIQDGWVDEGNSWNMVA